MGTPSITRIFNEDKKTIATIYRQFDGYPSGHGKELFDFLNGRIVVSGYGSGDKKISNGAGCLAAQLVMTLKDKNGSDSHKVGNIYLVAADEAWRVDFEYRLFVGKDGVKVSCASGPNNVLFSGSVEGFGDFCTSDDE